MKFRVMIIVALLAPGISVAADAGSVLFARGSVMADREPPVALAKGDAVLDDDTISTGAASRAQLLMIDGAKIAIRPNSILEIDAYTYASGPGQAVVSTSRDKAGLSLVKGGFRTITGAIGSQDRDDYEVRTPVGVLGIRGTDFALVFCRGDCNWAPGLRPGQPIEDGLYIGVTAGAIVFTNQSGQIVVEAGEYAFIPLSSRVPELLDMPPPLLIDDNDLRFDPDGSARQPGDDDDVTGFDPNLATRRRPESDSAGSDSDKAGDGSTQASPEQPIIGTTPDGTPIDLTPGDVPPPDNDRFITYSTGPLGRITQTFTATSSNTSAQLRTDANSDVTGFTGPFPGPAGPELADLDIGGAANVDTGFDTVTVLRWGRWAGGTATATLQSDGSTVDLDLNNQSLHWLAGPNAPAPVMPVTGVANYSLLGATSPTDSLGNSGVLGSAIFQADFTAMTVDSTLVIDIAGSTWNAAGTGDIGAAANLPEQFFSGLYGTVDVDGIPGGNGIFSGFFSQPGATSDPSFPGGVGLSYSLQDPQGSSTVSGAAVFGNP